VYLNSFIVVCVWYHATCLLGVGERGVRWGEAKRL